MHIFLFTLVLVLPLNLAASPTGTGKEFQIGEYRALSLFGEATTRPDTDYVSFTGDFGFTRLPLKNDIERHVAQESPLLANFQLRIINLEFMLRGNTGNEKDRQIDEAAIRLLKRGGYQIISRANNHAIDFGREGVEYNTRLLKERGFRILGTRNFPVYTWEAGGRKIAIFAVTGYINKPDLDGLILKLNESDLQTITHAISTADFRIAFAHLGSVSFYPSPHERRQVRTLIEAGADLVVCTGNHFIKGFLYERGKPVAYGIGNHMLSYTDENTESQGMHFVAGFRKGELVQLFVVPFYNAILSGKTGPLSQRDFLLFREKLRDRSTPDAEKYYSDTRSLDNLIERLARLNFADLTKLRRRDVVYAAGVLYYHHPLIVVGSALLTLVVVLLIVYWGIQRSRIRQVGGKKAINA
jgi:poly-gamma-glutamate synthesis protein (capsule biosynthesis protein)